MENNATSLCPPAISVREISVRYSSKRHQVQSDVVAVADVSCEIQEGEFVALIGPSGCGKSTLLKAIAGVIPISDGEVVFGRGPETRVGLVFQSDALLPWRTARANVELAFRLGGEDTNRVKDLTVELLQSLGLRESLDKYPGQLSGGMRKRVALARTLAYRPAIFMLDEPFSALDAQTRIHVGNFFLRILEDRKQTVVLVTHDIEEAVALADRILVMSSGPGRVAHSVDVPLSRPRDYHATRFWDGFAKLEGVVWNFLEESALERSDE